MVFGPALLDAYDAEQRLARYPRIVFAESAKQAVRDQLKLYPEMATSLQNDTMPPNSDDQYFVNYLDSVVAYEPDMGYPDTDAMARHRDIITKRLGDFARDPVCRDKYLWAARYHNRFCDERPDFGDELRVDISGIQI